MPIETATVLEFRLSREIPQATGFVLGLGGATLQFFSIAFHSEGAPIWLSPAGLLLLFLSVISFTFRKIVRIDKRTGKIEKCLSCLLWRKTQLYSISEFTGIGIGMAGTSSATFDIRGKSVYFLQLLGARNLSIPGMTNNKEAMISLAEQVGEYLNLPVEKTPRIVFFQSRF